MKEKRKLMITILLFSFLCGCFHTADRRTSTENKKQVTVLKTKTKINDMSVYIYARQSVLNQH